VSPSLHAERGDITTLTVDAIVNAANESLLGGAMNSTVDTAAGPELLAECRTLGGCATGDAKITRGYRLHAKYVIHTVGPVWQGGTAGEDRLLASCYRASLDLARRHAVTSLAFPAISTGVYRFPLERATRIAVHSVAEMLEPVPDLRVIFCCFSEEALRLYRDAIAKLTSLQS
jgi:O-acetyl-ADP-ribose deacetylase